MDGAHDGSFSGKTILSKSPGSVATPVTLKLLIRYEQHNGKTNLVSSVQNASKLYECFSYSLPQRLTKLLRELDRYFLISSASSKC